ncbi:MAG: helix-turn-helix transcriptional regulator [Ilumatobacteraceae bacterium]
MRIRDRIEDLARQSTGERALRVAILDEIRRHVPFESFVWLTTDPDSSVGSLPLAGVPDLREVPTLIRLRYVTADFRWTGIGTPVVSTLVEATDGDLSQSRLWVEGLARHAISDVVTTVLRDQYGCWGFIDLWRVGGVFTRAECALLEDMAPILTNAVRRSLMSTFEGTSSPSPRLDGPAIVMLDDDLSLHTQTLQADAYLRALLPSEGHRAPVPAAVYNVAAQVLAREAGIDHNPAEARLPLNDRWLTVRAARTEPWMGAADTFIAVSIEIAAPGERTSIYTRVAGLSEREGEVLRHLVTGRDTRGAAAQMFVSEHTVQDHLKSIFAKTGVNSRKMLIARATGAA